MNRLKKLLAVLVCMAMALTLVPGVVLAAETGTTAEAAGAPRSNPGIIEVEVIVKESYYTRAADEGTYDANDKQVKLELKRTLDEKTDLFTGDVTYTADVKAGACTGTFDEGNTNAAALIGYYCVAHVGYDEETDKPTIFDISTENGHNSVTTVTSARLADYDKDLSQNEQGKSDEGTVYYWKNSTSDRRAAYLTPDEDVKVYINYRLDGTYDGKTNGSYFKDLLDADGGVVNFIDNDNDGDFEFAMVSQYTQEGVIESVRINSAGQYVFRGMDGARAVPESYDPKDETKLKIFMRGDTRIDPAEIVAGDTITTVGDENDAIVIYLVSSEKIEGRSSGYDPETETLIVDGQRYAASPMSKYYKNDGLRDVRNTTGTFYLNSDGLISNIKVVNTAVATSEYGYILAVDGYRGFFNSTYEVQILDAATATVRDLTLSSTDLIVYQNAVTNDAWFGSGTESYRVNNAMDLETLYKQLEAIAAGTDNPEARVIKYTAENDVLKKLIFANNFEDINFNNISFGRAKAYDAVDRTIGGSDPFTDNSYVFVVKKGEDDKYDYSDRDYISVVCGGNFVDGAEYEVMTFSENDVVAAAVQNSTDPDAPFVEAEAKPLQGGGVLVSANVDGADGPGGPAVLIAAAYKDEALVDVCRTEISINAGETIFKELTLAKADAGCEIKVFVWNSLSGSASLCKAAVSQAIPYSDIGGYGYLLAVDESAKFGRYNYEIQILDGTTAKIRELSLSDTGLTVYQNAIANSTWFGIETETYRVNNTADLETLYKQLETIAEGTGNPEDRVIKYTAEGNAVTALVFPNDFDYINFTDFTDSPGVYNAEDRTIGSSDPFTDDTCVFVVRAENGTFDYGDLDYISVVCGGNFVDGGEYEVMTFSENGEVAAAVQNSTEPMAPPTETDPKLTDYGYILGVHESVKFHRYVYKVQILDAATATVRDLSLSSTGLTVYQSAVDNNAWFGSDTDSYRVNNTADLETLYDKLTAIAEGEGNPEDRVIKYTAEDSAVTNLIIANSFEDIDYANVSLFEDPDKAKAYDAVDRTIGSSDPFTDNSYVFVVKKDKNDQYDYSNPNYISVVLGGNFVDGAEYEVMTFSENNLVAAAVQLSTESDVDLRQNVFVVNSWYAEVNENDENIITFEGIQGGSSRTFSLYDDDDGLADKVAEDSNYIARGTVMLVGSVVNGFVDNVTILARAERANDISITLEAPKEDKSGSDDYYFDIAMLQEMTDKSGNPLDTYVDGSNIAVAGYNDGDLGYYRVRANTNVTIVDYSTSRYAASTVQAGAIGDADLSPSKGYHVYVLFRVSNVDDLCNLTVNNNLDAERSNVTDIVIFKVSDDGLAVTVDGNASATSQSYNSGLVSGSDNSVQ